MANSDRDGQMQLFQEAAEGLKEAAAVKRDSIDIRVQKMKEIVDASPDDHFLLWHDSDMESTMIANGTKVISETSFVINMLNTNGSNTSTRNNCLVV